MFLFIFSEKKLSGRTGLLATAPELTAVAVLHVNLICDML